MLEVTCPEYLESVREFADTIGLRENLEKWLTYLGEYATKSVDPPDPELTRCRLYKDWAPYSFGFIMERRNKDDVYERWHNGGLIFHGPHDGGGDGGAPTFSVCLNPTHGWSVHT